MRDDGQDRMEELGDLIDRAAGKLYPRGEHGKSIPDRDYRITRMFPYFLVVCLVIWVLSILYLQDYRFSKLLEILCLVFVVCFAILGVPCTIVMDRGVFSNWAVFGLAVLLTGILWLSGISMGQVYYAEAIENIMGAVGIHLDDYWQFILGFSGTLALVFFTSIGVLSVINAYMRRYVGDVFLAMQRRAGTGERGKAEKFFMVPEIIDVEEVILEPRGTDHVFDFRTALGVISYLFLLGLLVSSYVFLNPLLTSVLEWHTMLAVMLMLSMFTPALVLPWQIVRSVGAKVRSSAPRDYYLWTGARKRLFSTFATLGVFMLLFVLSVYLGNSIGTIVKSYVSFLIPLLVTSLIYGAIYANSFDRVTCRTICTNFEKGKDGRDDP